MKRILTVVAVLSILSIPAQAQEDELQQLHSSYRFNSSEVFIGAGVINARNIGYELPIAGVVFEARTRLSNRISLVSGGDYMPRAKKFVPGDGWNAGGGVGLRIYVADNIYVGPSIDVGRQFTSRWEKGVTYVGGTAGAQFLLKEAWRYEIASGIDYDVQSFDHGISVALRQRLYIPFGKETVVYEYPGALHFKERDTWGLMFESAMGYLNYRQRCTEGPGWERKNGFTGTYLLGIYRRF